MSELTVTLLRLGYLLLLWLFVMTVVRVLRRDIYGTTITRRVRADRASRENRTAARAAAAATAVPVAGIDTDRAEAPPTPARSGSSAGSRLTVTAGPLRGATLPLTSAPVVIGRDHSCTLVLDDDYASGRHARLYPQDGRWLVEDLGSTNGTVVGGERIESPVVLRVGGQIQIGRTVIELQA